jgi:hypothetical protein
LTNETGYLERNNNYEITSLTGTLSYKSDATTGGSFYSHLHMSVSDDQGACLGGHVMPGNIIFTTAEITMIESKAFQYRREFDNSTGFQELVVDYPTLTL